MMKIISSEKINGVLYNFYEGIDFNKLKNHSTDGSDGFIICFVKNWLKDELEYNRSTKIDNLLYNEENELFNWNDINNNYIIIYQCDNIKLEVMYEYIKENIEVTTSNSVWVAFAGLNKGAWNLTNALSNKINHDEYKPYVKKREL